jgi:uncharacterized membrane protein
MIQPITLLAIVVMASATYLTRITGYLLLRNRHLSTRAIAVMEAAPGCVLIAVIAPAFVAHRLSDLAALAITLVAASRLPMLPTVIIGIVSAGLLRHIMG